MLFIVERLAPVRDALLIALRLAGLMQQSLWLAVISNAIAVPVAIAGYALVTLNALRARGRGRPS